VAAGALGGVHLQVLWLYRFESDPKLGIRVKAVLVEP